MFPNSIGTKPTISAEAANGMENTDPKRAKPHTISHLDFLCQIGQENPHVPEVPEPSEYPEDYDWRTYVDPKDQQAIEVAVALGDVVDSGMRTTGDYPIYKFATAAGEEEIIFTLDPDAGEPHAAMIGAIIGHTPGDMHDSLSSAVWAVWCYCNPQDTGINTHNAIMRGITARYYNGQ